MRRDIVVFGASAGGIEALRCIVASLPPGFPAAICAVVHTSPDSPGLLHQILAHAGRLPARIVKDAEPLAPGTIYVPCPDHHLLLEPGRARATRGPKENRFRPAVDPLFRSAAQAYGPRVIGVVLTGGLDDGTAGLWTIKKLGGLAVVQDPADAMVPSMPANALRFVDVDHVAAVADLPALLLRLVQEDRPEPAPVAVPALVDAEVKIALEDAPMELVVEKLGLPSTFACPECHGVLREVTEDGRVRYRCHTGHAYSNDSLMEEFEAGIEAALWGSVRALQEKTLLVREMADLAERRGEPEVAQAMRAQAEQSKARAELVRKATLHPEPGLPAA